MTEINRLLCSKKRIIILLMLAVINLALFSGYCRAERRDRESYYEIMCMSGFNLQQMDEEEYKQYLTHDYPDYLNKMQEQAKNRLCFQSSVKNPAISAAIWSRPQTISKD